MAVIIGTHDLHNFLLKVPVFCPFSYHSECQDNIKKDLQENGIWMWVGSWIKIEKVYVRQNMAGGRVKY